MKRIAAAVAASLLCTAFGAYLFSRYVASQPQTVVVAPEAAPVRPAISFGASAPQDFSAAAELTVNGVVHVMIRQDRSRSAYGSDDLFSFFFGPQGRQRPSQPEVTGSGSGVIISPDGYIITNNHVIEGADHIDVVLNDKRSFPATLVGTDPTTDIALLKVDADGLCALSFGDSDALKVGEWVLAVGNPFNLTSTVTAGIVSAKSRYVGINQANMAIESFIQTDAAVNPGNSGGALVNTRGQLVGINTAIASTTGSFSGYSFAVPANIAQKVASDLKMYGQVQRALLGVSIREVDAALQNELGLDRPEGVAVMAVSDGGAAKEAGVKERDVILEIDGEAVNSVPELQGRVGQHRPGDSISLTVWRSGEKMKIVATLRNLHGTTSVIKTDDANMLLGARLEALSESDARSLGLRFGLRVAKVGNGKLFEAGVRDGFVISKANRVPISSLSDLQQVVSSASEGLFLAGIYPDGHVRYYAVNLQD